ncbi:prenyltransferase and squalene oxidase repeat-containing domain protein [Aneurinibacillus aneurinilyticus ATCC 12856]|uniref:Prenyltransferase and squalene oxidase repeat-containing domain protein n=1 Tax=Aneurinibacillus aneurinilyticus ATCC 12856 TaxID=649747 RepID=U1XZI7_ANEAE|nr:prenyltransferase and squalene oxidase repeat-containing domain protein [Aneurinibacillus aneurinilyticus ATCC 12856]
MKTVRSVYQTKFWRLLLAIIVVASFAIAPNIEAATSIVTRDEVKTAANKTIQYYHNTYKKKEFAGILDWPALGLFAFGEDVSGPKWTVNGKNGAFWREQQVRTGVNLSKTKNTDYQRTIIGVVAAGKDPRNFGGVNLVETVKNTMLANGHFADSVADNKTGKPVGNELVNAHIFGIIALHVAGEPIPNKKKATEWLVAQQHHDGGFTWDVKYFDDPADYQLIESDVDMTAAALMAFAILGLDEQHPAVARAFDFLKKKQLANGGFDSWGTENPESCAWVIQAIRLHGQDPLGPAWTKPSGGNPVSAMLRFQVADGSFTHVLSEEDALPVYQNSMSTEQALYGMADAYNPKAAYTMLHEKYRPTAEKNMFTDYKPGQFGFTETMRLVYENGISGYTDRTFKPEKVLTCAELEQWLSQLFTKAVAVTGKNEPVTGEQFMELIGKANGAVAANPAGYVEQAKQKGWLYAGFDAKKPVNRAQAMWSLAQVKK